MTIKERQDEIIDDFGFFGNWDDKYEYIIQLGKELLPMDPQYKVDENLIRGCQSKVWMHPDYKDGLITFTADSDAVITKGLVSLVIGVLSGHTPKEIVDADLYFINAIGLSSHLSPTRSNGLLSMVKQIKMYALAYQTKEMQS